MMLHGWGRYPKCEVRFRVPKSEKELIELLKSGKSIARGNGRGYGDCAISVKNTLHMARFNRILKFDKSKGLLVCESGVILSDILKIFIPRGWFPYVTPGTKYVTIGGMIAADIHGKNHHQDGSFGNFVEWIDVLDASGSVKRCSRTKNTKLFFWTVGGMGLTGIILRACIKLRNIESAWILQKTIPARNIDEIFDLFEDSSSSLYSVAWIDCMQRGKNLGRAVLMLGEHAKKIDLSEDKCLNPLEMKKSKSYEIPFLFPGHILNRTTAKLFNFFYYRNAKKKNEHQLVSWDDYFYPLDKLLNWNKVYGKDGFIQFQCVIPLKNAKHSLYLLLNEIAKSKNGAFLGVLKRFGKQEGLFSFPMEGYSLAIDFPVNRKTISLLSRLDRITIERNGRFYLAKDSRMSSSDFWRSEKRASEFLKFRKLSGADSMFCSEQSKRLMF